MRHLLVCLPLLTGVLASFDFSSPSGNSYQVSAPQPQQIQLQKPKEEVREVQRAAPIRILRMQRQMGKDGSYLYSYETENGIQMQEQGFQKESSDPKDEHPVQVAQGFYSYTSPEGIPISVNYIADDDGFRVFGDSFPAAPIPPSEQQKQQEPATTSPPPPSPSSPHPFRRPTPVYRPQPTPQSEPESHPTDEHYDLSQFHQFHSLY